MRRRFASVPPPFKAAALVFVMAYGLFSLTTFQLAGYEPETAAVTEGLVREGHFWDKVNSEYPLVAETHGKGNHRYARTGLLQPLLEAPFFAAGHLADKHIGPIIGEFLNGLSFLWFYNPFVAALSAVAIFALVYLTRRSLKWASTIAALFVFASIAWPYSKIGMETTFMFAITTAFALGVWARRSPSALSWGLTGFATGAAVATKAYTALAVLPLLVLLVPTFLALDRRRQLQLGLAACLPVLLWAAAIGYYNWARFGSATNFGYNHTPLNPLTAPFNALGLLFSPGKGLVLYSPLVVLGALGVPRMWRQDRTLTAALLTLFGCFTVFSATTAYWGDEVWGPRYIAPVAWTLLIPIAWWAGTRFRQKILLGVATLAFLVQVVGVSGQYGHYTDIARGLTGVPLYEVRYGLDPEKIPYGDDPTRWMPELSALLIQTEGLISSQVVERLGGSGIDATYAPFEGRSRTVNLSDPKYRIPLDFWWILPPRNQVLDKLLAALAAIAAALAAAGIYLLSFGRRWPLSAEPRAAPR
jgi:hypothetical protein